MIKDFFYLAFKNLKSRGVRSWLTLLGVFIGITAVVSLISLGNGLELAVGSQFGIGSSQLITVQAGGISGFGPPGSFVVDSLISQDSDAIEKLSSVENTVTRILELAEMEFNKNFQFIYVGSAPGVKEDLDLIYSQLNLDTFQGRLLTDSDSGKVVLGYNFYDKDEEWGGKKIVSGKSVYINDKKFQVAGIFEKRGSYIFDNIILMPESDMSELFDFGDNVDVIVVEPKDKGDISKTKEDIEDLLRDRRGVKKGEEDFEVSTPESTLSTINGVLKGVKLFVAIIASISILVGLIGIINTMTTSVMERKKEIGISKSVGARNEHIFLQFFIESSLLGLVGGIAGAIIGTSIGFIGIYGINNWIGTDLTPAIDFVLISLALVGSFLVGGIAGILPAIKASMQNPVESLRG
tara:strand:+ start:1819 stop:3042 length:1224 start_codon:yes stop_codon:yes gene_type:complete